MSHPNGVPRHKSSESGDPNLDIKRQRPLKSGESEHTAKWVKMDKPRDWMWEKWHSSKEKREQQLKSLKNNVVRNFKQFFSCVYIGLVCITILFHKTSKLLWIFSHLCLCLKKKFQSFLRQNLPGACLFLWWVFFFFFRAGQQQTSNKGYRSHFFIIKKFILKKLFLIQNFVKQ